MTTTGSERQERTYTPDEAWDILLGHGIREETADELVDRFGDEPLDWDPTDLAQVLEQMNSCSQWWIRNAENRGELDTAAEIQVDADAIRRMLRWQQESGR